MAARTALQSTTASTVNITSQQTIGTYAASAGQVLKPVLRLTSLNGAAATFTAAIRNTTDGIDVYAYSEPKRTATDTGKTFIFPAFEAIAKSYAIQVTSTNSSDTSVTWAIDWYDATQVETTNKTGYSLAADQSGVTIGTVTTLTNKTGFSLSSSQTFDLTGNITGNLSGSAGSVTGAVGSVTGNVGGSVGSISGVTFPTNFATLGINASGHVSRVTLVDTTTTNTDVTALPAALLATTNGDATVGTQLGRLDATVESRQATFTSSTGVTLPATVPTAAQNASTLLGTTNGDATVGVQLGTAAANTGTGARTVAITVNDGATALQNARVRLTEGANTYTATTSALGVATFNVDDAVYSVAISKGGYFFAGTTLTVDGDESPTYSMTQITVTPADDPDQTTASLTTYDGQGNVAGGVVLRFKLVKGPGNDAQSHKTAEFTATSNASTGLLTVSLLRSAVYQAMREAAGKTSWVTFATPDTATYELPEILGSA